MKRLIAIAALGLAASCGQGAPGSAATEQAPEASIGAETLTADAADIREISKDGFNACPYTATEMRAAFGLSLSGAPDLSMLESASLASCRYHATDEDTYVQVDYLWLPPERVAQSIATASTGRAGSVTPIPNDADHASFQANTEMDMYALDYFRGDVMVTVRLLEWRGGSEAARTGLLSLPRHP